MSSMLPLSRIALGFSGPPNRAARLRAAFRAVEGGLVSRTVRHARGLVQTLRLRAAWNDRSAHNSANDEDTTSASRVRVLRWVFARGSDRLVCQLALSSEDACYELRTISSVAAAEPLLERFADAAVAFERQSEIENALVTAGWTLDSYESVLTGRSSTFM